MALDALLPAERTVAVDSGHLTGCPAMYMRVPDPRGFVFAKAFQSIGLGLGGAIGAAVARPDRLPGRLRRRRRPADGAPRSSRRSPGCGCRARRGLRRRGLRRGGAPLRAAGLPSSSRGSRTRRRRTRARRRRQGPTARHRRPARPLARWLERRDGPLVLRCEDHTRLLRGMARGGLRESDPSPVARRGSSPASR